MRNTKATQNRHLLSSEHEDSSTLMEVPDEVEPEIIEKLDNDEQNHKDFTDVEIATNSAKKMV